MYIDVSKQDILNIAKRIIDYYSYYCSKPSLDYNLFSSKQIADFLYTYPGEHLFINLKEEFDKVKYDLIKGDQVPLLVFKKKDNYYLFDGHIRALVSFMFDASWNVYVLSFQDDCYLGLENLVLGKVKHMQKYLI